MLQGLQGACASMGNPAMAIPAFAGGVHLRDQGVVATDAIRLDHGGAVIRNSNPLRHSVRVENQDVFHAVYAFPDVMGYEIVVGKMTFNAFQPTMRAVVHIGVVLRLHHVTTGAESRRLRFGQQLRRPKQQEEPEQYCAECNCNRHY